jgi:uncharacterized membrane protein (DUF4010 family)
MEIAHINLNSLAAALGIGLMVGIERERHHHRENRHNLTGIRTFAITALLGCCALIVGGQLMLAVTLFGLVILLALSYWYAAEEDPGLTTEVALLLVFILGAMTVSHSATAVAIGVVLTLLLSYREKLHAFVRTQLTDDEIQDALTLATAALVILPLLPDRYMGPYDALNPRTLWLVSVLMMSISAVGHVAMRLIGPRYGLPVAGLFAGFASSTATIATMGAMAKAKPELLGSAATAAIISCLSTMLQLMLLLVAIDSASLQTMLIPLLAGALASVLYGAYGLLTWTGGPAVIELGRAFNLKIALAIGASVGIVQLLSAVLFAWKGSDGLLLATTISGFADTHAAAASVANLAHSDKIPVAAIVVPILGALSSNTLSKCFMAWVAGGKAFSLRVIPGLILVLMALWGAWWLG